MISHSAASSGPSLRSTASGTPILPTSWSRAPISSSESSSSLRPSLSPTRRARRTTACGVLAGVVVAHLDRPGHRLDAAVGDLLMQSLRA